MFLFFKYYFGICLLDIKIAHCFDTDTESHFVVRPAARRHLGLGGEAHGVLVLASDEPRQNRLRFNGFIRLQVECLIMVYITDGLQYL